MSQKRLVVLPALVFAAALVVIAYQVRMRTNRPDVPLPVSATVDHFAKGLAIGAEISDARSHLGAPVWHPGLGYVGGAPEGGFDHAMVIPAIADRFAPGPGDGARVETIELFADNKREMVNTMSDLAIAFRGIPRMGCITRLDGRHDEVQYWVTRRDLGGVAVITAWGGDSVIAPGVYTWSLVAWAGPFKGSETLDAPFDARPCDGANSAVVLAPLDSSVAARERAQTSFTDVLRGQVAANETSEAAARAELSDVNSPPPCDVPPQDETAVTRRSLYGFSIDLPEDFTLVDSIGREKLERRAGAARYRWVTRDGSEVTVESVNAGTVPGAVGLLLAECDKSVNDHDVHFAVGNASVNFPKLTVAATYSASPRLSLAVVGSGRSRARQRQLLRAANSVLFHDRWGKGESDP